MHPKHRPALRRIATTRGVYFVPWNRSALLTLLDQEKLRPADFLAGSRHEIKQLVRDLFLVGVEDEMVAGEESRLTRVARRLLRSITHDAAFEGQLVAQPGPR